MPGDTARPANSASALELLPLPKVQDLSASKLRGATCAWCNTPLTAETARDLGERPAPDGGTMFPRGCTRCVNGAARDTYLKHHRTCEQCVDDPTLCDTHRALRRLALETRQ